ncbi:MAG: hypothetical protein E5X96_11935, partial [Mesorhizobium sp.]
MADFSAHGLTFSPAFHSWRRPAYLQHEKNTIGAVNPPSRLMLHFGSPGSVAFLESSVHRRVLTRLVAAAVANKRSFLPPLVLGLGFWVGFPS